MPANPVRHDLYNALVDLEVSRHELDPDGKAEITRHKFAQYPMFWISDHTAKIHLYKSSR
eukprot:gnl/Chilomastix_caulleri/4438.p2 GENE.gnl/Chilomastix_caulleri/4438~~gnl/Chilomastix_caulleri/4438.p2  ORF type:complete len:60 (-),score=2.74 gnl/Chilomastix_caulleri/4438:81-260(-)